MKKKIYSALIALATIGSTALIGCSEEQLSSTSVIKTSKTPTNDFDKWLMENYLIPYNINFVYRYEDKEADMNYYTIPAHYDEAVKMAHLIKYLCLESYDEIAGIDFTRGAFAKQIVCLGEFQYKNNGTMILGTAENGKKIVMTGCNQLPNWISSSEMLNEYYIKTIHHEFTHILNQTKDYPVAFKLITASGYVGDSWSTDEFAKPAYYLTHGFISDYAQHSDVEDMAEMMSIYVTSSEEHWNELMEQAGTEGAAIIQSKLDIVLNYMLTSWNIDLSLLRDAVQRRQADVDQGKVNLTDLTVK